jgi:bifunctional DNA-binding transcriptional regulator/antitoxin component of YhaV-PrlF toxin-antitoxin module
MCGPRRMDGNPPRGVLSGGQGGGCKGYVLDPHATGSEPPLPLARPLDKELVLAKVRIMSKVTSKLQITIPRALADRYGIRPGDRVRWDEYPLGPLMVRLAPGSADTVAKGAPTLANGPGGTCVPATLRTPEERIAHFDAETARLRRLQSKRRWKPATTRGWTRADLYGDRVRPR